MMTDQGWLDRFPMENIHKRSDCERGLGIHGGSRFTREISTSLGHMGVFAGLVRLSITAGHLARLDAAHNTAALF